MTLFATRRKSIYTLAVAFAASTLATGTVAAQATEDAHAHAHDETTIMMHGDEPRVDPASDRRNASATVPSTGDNRIDALMSGYKWSVSTITYSFYENDVYKGSYYGSETGVTEVSENVKKNVRQILSWYSSLVNLNFVEVSEHNGQVGMMRFMLSNEPSYAYAYYPTSTSTSSVSADVHLSKNFDHANDTNGFQTTAGRHGYMSLIHEIGHTLGLKHPHQGSPVLSNDDNNTAKTVMSYSFLGNSSGTPMAYDILALQYLYGARSKNTGNETYAFTSRGPDQYVVGGTTHSVTSFNTKQTIWDTAGTNTLDFSNLPAASTGYSFDLNEGGWLIPISAYKTTYFNYGSVIAYGVKVNNIVNSTSSDTIFANPQANVFGGYSPTRNTGADFIYDATSADTVDLSAYSSNAISQSRSGNDHVISLGSNGSITLKDYYAGKQPRILVGTTTVVKPSITISDATVVEGNSGSLTANFAVKLSTSSTQSITVNYSTANGTAISGSDYTAKSGTLTFNAGEITKTISVSITGDTAVELDEVFYVNLSGVSSNATIADNQAVGTILNDDQIVSVANLAPVIYLNSNLSSGKAPLAIGFDAAGSYDPDGTIASYTWNMADGTIRYGKYVSHVFEKAGTFNVVLTVADNKGAVSTKTKTITVTSTTTTTTPPPPTPDPDVAPTNTVSISVIKMSTVVTTSGTNARALVYVVDQNGNPAANAVITGTWSGIWTGTQSGATGSAGGFAFNTPQTSLTGTATFTIKSITKDGYTYDASKNTETSDSTVLSVNQEPVAKNPGQKKKSELANKNGLDRRG